MVEKNFPEEKIRDVYQTFFAYAGRFAIVASAEYENVNVTVDPLTALSVVVSSYDDIKRYKWYHLEDFELDKSDAVKRAAYFAKWILKFRPLMISRAVEYKSPNEKTSDYSLFLNEILALNWGLTNIANELGVRRIRPTELLNGSMLYDFHFRELSGDALLAIFGFIAETVRRPDTPQVERL